MTKYKMRDYIQLTMKSVAMIACVYLFLPLSAFGSTLLHSPVLSERPVTFSFTNSGDVLGVTEEGTRFSQRLVANDYNIKLQKFTIADISFYVSARGVIEAPNDTVALSIYFARV